MKKLIALLFTAVISVASLCAGQSALWNIQSLANWNDLTTPSKTAQYPLGSIIEIYNSTYDANQKYEYVQAGAALTAYVPYQITYSSTTTAMESPSGAASATGGEITTATPATLAAPGAIICFPQVAFTAGYYGFVLIGGDGKALAKSQSYSAGDFFMVSNTTATAISDEGSTQTANSIGIFKEYGSTAVARKVYLLGYKVVIPAS